MGDHCIRCVFDGDSFAMNDLPAAASWLWYEVDALGEDFTVRTAFDDQDGDSWEVAMRAGLSPGQSFTVLFSSFRSYRSYEGEYDTEFEAEVVAIESRTDTEHLAAWEELFADWAEPLVVPVVGGCRWPT